VDAKSTNDSDNDNNDPTLSLDFQHVQCLLPHILLNVMLGLTLLQQKVVEGSLNTTLQEKMLSTIIDKILSLERETEPYLVKGYSAYILEVRACIFGATADVLWRFGHKVTAIMWADKYLAIMLHQFYKLMLSSPPTYCVPVLNIYLHSGALMKMEQMLTSLQPKKVVVRSLAEMLRPFEEKLQLARAKGFVFNRICVINTSSEKKNTKEQEEKDNKNSSWMLT